MRLYLTPNFWGLVGVKTLCEPLSKRGRAWRERAMRAPHRTLALGLSVFFLVAFGQGAMAYERCSLCGMDVDKSETAYYVRVESGRVYPLCSLQCVHVLMMNVKEKPVSIRTEDYPTSRLIDARAAHFLCESRLVPKGSMQPYILAFASRDKAESYQKEYGGRILDFDGAIEIIENTMMEKKR